MPCPCAGKEVVTKIKVRQPDTNILSSNNTKTTTEKYEYVVVKKKNTELKGTFLNEGGIDKFRREQQR